MCAILAGPVRARKLACVKLPRFLLDVVSRAAPEAACGAEPKASTERVKMTGVARTLDSTGRVQPIARGRSRALPAVSAPQPSPASSDTGCNRRGCPSGARSFKTGVQTFPSFGLLTGASVFSGALLGRTSVRLVVLQGSFSKE